MAIRVLLLSESIAQMSGSSGWYYEPPYDIDLDIGNPNQKENFNFSAFDYDVTIVHIVPNPFTTSGYYQNLKKIYKDSYIALQHGRTVICIPESGNFLCKSGHDEEYVYNWIMKLGVKLQDNIGESFRPSGAGQASVITEYLQSVKKYYQIIKEPEPSSSSTLAVVDGTNIVISAQHNTVGTGSLVILPPPDLDNDNYLLSIARLIDVARRYQERAQRKIPVGDTPNWLNAMLPASVRSLNQEIERLKAEKSKYDLIAYVTYGTGEELEDTVELLLSELGLTVERQPKGANIDLKAKHAETGLGFAIEVTGTKGTIQKDSDKVPQSWQYLSDRVGTPEEKDRLIVVANTQYNLDPSQRRPDSFSPPVLKLLGGNGVLLITTLQLYTLWKDVYERRVNALDVIKKLHESSGLFA